MESTFRGRIRSSVGAERDATLSRVTAMPNLLSVSAYPGSIPSRIRRGKGISPERCLGRARPFFVRSNQYRQPGNRRAFAISAPAAPRLPVSRTPSFLFPSKGGVQ